MSLDKAIKSVKEKLTPYRGSKAVDHSCRNNGGCPWCESNRKYQERRLEALNELTALAQKYGEYD